MGHFPHVIAHRLVRLVVLFSCFPSKPQLFSLFVSDVTQILNAIEQGDSQAAERLLPLVYDELRRLAA
jgi:hypothetical protein